jgi:hypothetical protein
MVAGASSGRFRDFSAVASCDSDFFFNSAGLALAALQAPQLQKPALLRQAKPIPSLTHSFPDNNKTGMDVKSGRCLLQLW